MNMMLRMDISNKAWQCYMQDVSPSTLRIFKQFLITNSVFKQYFQNFVTFTQDLSPYIIKEFKHFCIVHNIYIPYIHNFHHNPHSTRADSNSNLISQAFVWSDTPQGSNFWLDLHVEWLKIVDSNKKTYYGYKTETNQMGPILRTMVLNLQLPY